jgi:hypothetical protein
MGPADTPLDQPTDSSFAFVHRLLHRRCRWRPARPDPERGAGDVWGRALGGRPEQIVDDLGDEVWNDLQAS